MCGFVGMWEPGSHGEALGQQVAQMTETLAHRGPDDSGVWLDAAAGIGMGFRRLAIVDLSPHGHQPMVSASGRYVLVFNGEMYNFTTLRGELLQHGHRFRGHSDTEVLLAAIEQWGLMGAVPRLTGMFAFALWDRQTQRLALVRDRVGIKPLYYGWIGEAFVCGSELKALYAHTEHRLDVDRDALALLLRYGYVPAPYTICRGIAKLSPGCILILDDSTDTDAAPVPYWSAYTVAQRGQQQPFSGSPADAIASLDELLRTIMQTHMVADVPLGAFLSGGIDSSLVVALLQAQHSQPVKTFSIGFHESAYDEARYARAVAAHLGTDHTELYVTPAEAQMVIPRLPTIYDEPFADPSQIPTLLVSQLARRHVTVSLSGDGGDELFGGYERYARARMLWRVRNTLPIGLREPLCRGIAALAPAHTRLHDVAELLTRPTAAAFYQRFAAHWEDPTHVVRESIDLPTPLTDRTHWGHLTGIAAQMMYADLLTYLPDDILVKVDRASMATGLEARVPLLDHRLVEWAWQVPMALKLRGGTGKWLLRQVLYRYVPRQLVERPKQGFSVPLHTWLRGPLRPWADELLDERRLRDEGFFDPAAICAKWAEHRAGKRDWQQLLWNVLMFQAWWEQWRLPTGDNRLHASAPLYVGL